MATMKLYELVNHYHIGTELTCAEAVFMACNEYYHLNLSEETRKMFSVMGLGMQTEQSCCGAFTVAVGIIGLMTAKEGQTDVSNMEGYQMIADLTDFTLGIYGTLHPPGRSPPPPAPARPTAPRPAPKGGGSPCLNYPRKKYNHFVAGSATESRD